MRRGAADYLLKDRLGRLPAAIRQAVAQCRMQREKQRVETLLSAVVDAAPLGILTLDLAGRVQSWNPAAEAIFGFTQAESLHRPLQIIPPDAQAEEVAIQAKIRSGKCLTDLSVQRLQKAGTLVDVSLCSAPLRDSTGQIHGIVHLFADLTEQRSKEKQFRHAQKMEALGQLAGGIAHDFNNLLTAIHGFADLLAMKLGHEDARQEDAIQIRSVAKRGADLTQQLLSFSRGAGLQSEVFCLNQLIRDTLRMLRRIIGGHLEIVTDLAPDLGNIRADQTQIHQVILNLAINAREAMPAGGTFTICTNNFVVDDDFARLHPGLKPGRYVAAAFTDTGHGMDEAVQQRIFEPFFTTKGEKGTGLGLSTSYGIIKESGGYLEAHSAPGKGTTFFVYLPLIEQELPSPPETSLRQPIPGGETLLLVEDDPQVRLLVSRILQASGYRVFEAANGEDALRWVAQFPERLDLIITDIVMPRMDGRELATRLSQTHPQIPILYISGYAGHGSVDGLPSSALLLRKPFNPWTLSSSVRQLLDAPPAFLDLFTRKNR